MRRLFVAIAAGLLIAPGVVNAESYTVTASGVFASGPGGDLPLPITPFNPALGTLTGASYALSAEVSGYLSGIAPSSQITGTLAVAMGIDENDSLSQGVTLEQVPYYGGYLLDPVAFADAGAFPLDLCDHDIWFSATPQFFPAAQVTDDYAFEMSTILARVTASITYTYGTTTAAVMIADPPSDPPSGPVPEPASLALLGTAILSYSLMASKGQPSR